MFLDERLLEKSLIWHEMTPIERIEMFDIRKKKFIQHIDSFYYSVYLDADFTAESKDERVTAFRRFVGEQLERCRFDEDVTLNIKGVPMYFTCYKGFYGRMYNFMLRRADHYVIYFADYTFNEISPQVLVQIESKALWMEGVRESVENTLADVRSIAEAFRMNIAGAFENRIDYCWHTNYLRDPEKFLRADNFAKMLLSRLRSSFTHEEFSGRERYEIDYRTLGVRKSNNVFFRFYNKAKEVIEHSEKGFFLKYWYLNKLINRYDLIILEDCYEQRSWSYMSMARIKFYRDNGLDPVLRQECQDIIDGNKVMDSDALLAFADMLTPRVTHVYNVEFQTMRKFSATLELDDTEFNMEKYGPVVRLFTILDDWRAICNTLTSSVVRLVTPEGDDNKSRRDDCPFWDALRRSRNLELKHYSGAGKILRTYQHNKDSDLVKKRALSAVVSWNLYKKGLHDDSADNQMIDFLNSLNDYDYDYIFSNRNKKINRADYSDAEGLDVDKLRRRYQYLDTDTGEYYD